MILNILLALVSLFTEKTYPKTYWAFGEIEGMIVYDFKCDGLYYEFADENEVNLVREKPAIIQYGWLTDVEYLYTIAYDNRSNVCYVGDIVIPDSVSYEGRKYKVASINTYALSFSRGLKSITFTSDIPIKFPVSDYYGEPNREGAGLIHNRDLTTVTYYDSTTTIISQLRRCPSLKTVNFPYKLESIVRSFEECGFTEVDLDNHGDYNPSRFTLEESFDYSTSLRKIKFPECDTLVFKNNRFSGCPNIEAFVLRPCSVIVQGSNEFLSYTSSDSKKWNARVISESVVPPKVIPMEDGESFRVEYRHHRMLYVPGESVSAYREAPYWKDFWHICPISEYYALEMVEVESPVAEAANVSEILLDSKGAELHISVSEPTEVSVWSIQGAQVWRGRIADDTTLSLPHGMYIITTPTSTMKYSH